MQFSPSHPLQRALPALCAVVRLLLASAGGYALAVALAFALARGLPTSRADASVAAGLAAILAMPAAAVWAYAVPRLWHAAAGILGLAALCGAAAFLIGRPG